MEFCKTETYRNLAKSFAGESQAGMRYQMLAAQAEQEGLVTLANAVRSIAHNETVHAKQFYWGLIKQGEKSQTVSLEQVDYPFQFGSLEENLRYAAEGEHHEHAEVYPAFARTAEREGYAPLAKLWENIAQIESHHEIIFAYLQEAYRTGTLFEADHPMLWICSECGYMHTAKEAWKVCPVCHAPQGSVQLHLPFGED